MAEYKTPGVYVEEIPGLPPSIASVETAIPAFIGYTEKAMLKEADDLILKPWRIGSMLEYEQYFGMAMPEISIEVGFDLSNPSKINVTGKVNPATASKFLMNYSLQLFFANGGGYCYITSVGNYSAGLIHLGDLQKGLEAVGKTDGITLLVFPDAANLATATDCYTLYKAALGQCAQLQDRFAVMDVWTDSNPAADNVQVLRNVDFDEDALKYGAVYYPRLYTSLDYYYTDEWSVKINGVAAVNTLAALKSVNNAFYDLAKGAIADIELLLPASGAVVGAYASVDNARGVWKAPANIGLQLVLRPEIMLNNQQQENLNVDVSGGKSINVIRSFPGNGVLIWGARTLAGNDMDWRYVSVRRFFIMVEESVRIATLAFVFEPNDLNTWTRIKAMISNYLLQLWKSGALMGAKTQDAFFIHIGLGETMTAQDILEGRLTIEIGMAVVRPAEFIVVRFSHKMSEA